MATKDGRKTGGRKKGTPNKVSRDLKAAIIEAAERAGNKLGKDGMISYLEVQAIENPGPFMTLLGKVLPMQLTGPDDGPIEVVGVKWEICRPEKSDDGTAEATNS